MERDINVVAQVKDNGDVSYRTGDGLLLRMGAGGTKLYKHSISFNVENYGEYNLEIISNSASPITNTNDIAGNIFIQGMCSESNIYVMGMVAESPGLWLFIWNNIIPEVTYLMIDSLPCSDTVTEW